MKLFNNLKTWLRTSLLAGSLLISARSEETSELKLSISDCSPSITNSSMARVYALFDKTNLLDFEWNEITRNRGTASNLVFNVNNTNPIGFYKAKSVYDPISPVSMNVSYTCQPTGGNPPSNLDFDVNNFDTTNLEAIVSFTETMNPYNASYTVNMPFTQVLVPGENRIRTQLNWITHNYGSTVYGQVDIKLKDK